ncbi:MAG: trypsin-like serine protease [Polyangiaceae bacterium]
MFAVLVALSCGTSAPDAPETRRVREAIVSGTPDTAHTAVVGLYNVNPASSFKYGTCSGTIVSVQNGIGIVLTAAHCCGALGDPLRPNIIVAADDMAPYLADIGNAHPKPPAFAVIPSSIKTDPVYDPKYATHDFCMFEFWGATSDLAAIPVAGTDALQPSSVVEFVGFGSTGGTSGGDNTLRNHITRPLSAVDPMLLVVNEASGGPCEGDSGGAVLFPADGAENSQTVVGVISAGSPGCNGTAGSSRVMSAMYPGGFISSYLAHPPPAPSVPGSACDKCRDEATSVGGACFDVGRACTTNGDCGAIWSCASACADADSTCRDRCETAHPTGADRYDALDACLCGSPCGAACAARCPPPPSAKDAGSSRAPAPSSDAASDAPPSPPSDGGCTIQPAPQRGASALGGPLAVLALALGARRRRNLS